MSLQQTPEQSAGWHIVADIGGTNARFALAAQAEAPLQCVSVYRCADFVRFEDALEAYQSGLRAQSAPQVLSVCLAVAAAVHKDLITLTNHPWQFSRRALQTALGVPVQVLNDFTAQALCLPLLGDADVQWLRRGTGRAEGAARTIAGPGTGFGGATLTAAGDVLESEPGHCSFAPVTEHELQLLQVLWRRYPRVCVEQVLSGPGLANLYWANAVLSGNPRELEAAAIVNAAQHGDALALQTLRDFSGILGSVCGDIALSMGSLGGFYLSGGVLEKMGALFDQTLFMTRFVDKGAFQNWCSEVPVANVTLAWPGLLGCARHARRQTQMNSADRVIPHAS
ncbi:MAG: glucokinase [Pseudomonadota bacterium]